MEHKKSLKLLALFSQFPYPVQTDINELFPFCEVTASEIVGGVLLGCEQLVCGEEVAVGASSDLVDCCWFEVYEEGSWDEFGLFCL